jgi:hypothetical protein
MKAAVWLKRVCAGLGILGVFAGCSTGLRPGAPGPGVPVISNLRVDRRVAKPGQTIRIRFEFNDPDADVTGAEICYVRTERWSRATITTGDCGHILIDPSLLRGHAAGIIEAPHKWSRPGRYDYETQVMDAQGHKSNVLRGSVTVR